MARWLAIDFGLKRCGVAVTDPLKIIATALDTIATKQLVPFLSAYFLANMVDQVVIGMPKQPDGTDSSLAPAVRQFIALFKKTFPTMPIVTANEMYTTVLAHRIMLASGISKSKRAEKGTADRISAVIILQDYMQKMGI